MELKDGYWTDENNNRWNAETYSGEESKIKSDTMTDCRRCVNCEHCTRCDDCSDCRGCVGCINCIFCVNCCECDDCLDCTRCRYCKFTEGVADQSNLDDTFVNGVEVDFEEWQGVYIGKYEDRHVIAIAGSLMFVDEDQISRA